MGADAGRGGRDPRRSAMNRRFAGLLGLILAGASTAAVVPVTYTIKTIGHGPGTGPKTRAYYWFVPPCDRCTQILGAAAGCGGTGETNIPVHPWFPTPPLSGCVTPGGGFTGEQI